MNRLRVFREHFGMTQKDMANVLGMTKMRYCLKEKGKIAFTIEEALIVAKALNQTVEKIFRE